MALEGLLLCVTHTGKAADSVHISDITDGVDVLASFRKAGPIYVPTPAKGGISLLVYSGSVAISHASGGICKFVEQGYLTAKFVAGAQFAALLPTILDEGVELTTKPTSIDFVGAGVTATVVGDDVTVTIPGGGAATDHDILSNLGWDVAAHTGTAGSFPTFDGAGDAAYLTGVSQGDLVYFDGTTWTRLAPGNAGEVLTTQGVGGNPTWSPQAGASAPLLWGANSISSSTTTRYLFPGYDNSLAQTAVIQTRAPRAGTIQSLRVRQQIGAGNGSPVVYTLRVNGVASLLTVSLASTATDGADLVDTVPVAAGDLLDIEITKAASVGTSPTDVTATAELV